MHGMHDGWWRPLWVKCLEWMMLVQIQLMIWVCSLAHAWVAPLADNHCWQCYHYMPWQYMWPVVSCLISLVPKWSSIFLVVELPKIHVRVVYHMSLSLEFIHGHVSLNKLWWYKMLGECNNVVGGAWANSALQYWYNCWGGGVEWMCLGDNCSLHPVSTQDVTHWTSCRLYSD